MNTMHCIHCGAQLPEGAKFCTSCGRPVQAPTASPVEEPVAEERSAEYEPIEESTQEQEAGETYTPPVNASEGYKAANAQLPPSYSDPNYSSQAKSPYTVPSQSPANSLAIAGFVCSLIFIPIGIGVLTAIAGLVLSIMGLSNAKKMPENKGHGLAVAGTIISAVRIVLSIVIIIALIAFMIRGAGHVGHEIISNWQNYNPYNF